MKDKYKEIIGRATKVWGPDSQFEMVIEECSELIMAIQKCKREGYDVKKRVYNLIEEIADVEIAVDAIKQLLGEEACKQKFKSKIKRLERRVDNAEKSRER